MEKNWELHVKYVDVALGIKIKTLELIDKYSKLTVTEKGKYVAFKEAQSLLRSDDPVRDAQKYYDYCEKREQEREYIRCDICGEKIYKGDSNYEGSLYYVLDGQNICEHCIEDYVGMAAHTYE